MQPIIMPSVDINLPSEIHLPLTPTPSNSGIEKYKQELQRIEVQIWSRLKKRANKRRSEAKAEKAD